MKAVRYSVLSRIATALAICILLQVFLAGSVFAEKKKVTFWLFGVPVTMQDWVTTFQDRFNEENPDIELEARLASWN